MTSIDCTLLSDGTSDIMLIPSIKWLLDQYFPLIGFNFELAKLGDKARKTKFEKKLCLALELYPCDILFIHRDVEKESIEIRKTEIERALENSDCIKPNVILTIPKRMSEAWLLIDEEAIRLASGNPNGSIPLSLPKISKLESIPDPKKLLIDLIKTATELNNRRLKGFRPRTAIHQVSEYIEDYSILRELESFQFLESQIKNIQLVSE